MLSEFRKIRKFIEIQTRPVTSPPSGFHQVSKITAETQLWTTLMKFQSLEMQTIRPLHPLDHWHNKICNHRFEFKTTLNCNWKKKHSKQRNMTVHRLVQTLGYQVWTIMEIHKCTSCPSDLTRLVFQNKFLQTKYFKAKLRHLIDNFKNFTYH